MKQNHMLSYFLRFFFLEIFTIFSPHIKNSYVYLTQVSFRQLLTLIFFLFRLIPILKQLSSSLSLHKSKWCMGQRVLHLPATCQSSNLVPRAFPLKNSRRTHFLATPDNYWVVFAMPKCMRAFLGVPCMAGAG